MHTRAHTRSLHRTHTHTPLPSSCSRSLSLSLSHREIPLKHALPLSLFLPPPFQSHPLPKRLIGDSAHTALHTSLLLFFRFSIRLARARRGNQPGSIYSTSSAFSVKLGDLKSPCCFLCVTQPRDCTNTVRVGFRTGGKGTWRGGVVLNKGGWEHQMQCSSWRTNARQL